jgi:hypothetical protein
MPDRELPARSNLEQYKKQAKELLKRWRASDGATTRKLADAQFEIAHDHGFTTWKAFTDEISKRNGAADTAAIWKSAEDALVAGDDVTLARLLDTHGKMMRTERPQTSWFGGLTPDYSTGGAREIIAREHCFGDWDQFAAFAADRRRAGSSVGEFERAVDAVASGDSAALEQRLRQHPELSRARSTRSHHSMLLHYVGANGVESWRQRPSKNAVRIAEILLDAGAEIDAFADMYKGGCTPLGLIATSIHPKTAGVLRELIDLFLARGARIDVTGAGNAHAFVNGCLANGRLEAADHLARRGAPLDLEGAAGLGRLDLLKSFFDSDGTLKATATATQMYAGFNWACQYGHTAAVEFLLEHGVSLNDPRQIGVYWAGYGGHVEMVRALLKRNPPLDIRDASFSATPLGWAVQGWWERRETPEAREPYYEVVSLLVAAGAPIEPRWLSGEDTITDPRMLATLRP